MEKKFLWLVTLILFAGCFDARFEFKTQVRPDGSVVRFTHMDGRGANLFKVPEGPGWTAKSWETKGEEAFIADTYYHVEARGNFKLSQLIPPDYDFNFSKQAESWGDKEKSRLQVAGIQAPYEDHLFSRNKVQVSVIKGVFTITTFYEETFQNVGVMPLLLLDLKEEVRKQSQNRGDALKEPELEELARLRLEDEILPEIQFHSEVSMPGKIVSSNAKQVTRGKAVWEFSMKDFEDHYSIYTLRATSRSLRLPGFIILIGVGLFSFAVFVIVTMGIRKQKDLEKEIKKSKKRREEKEN